MASNLFTFASETLQVPINLAGSLELNPGIWPQQANIINGSSYDYIVIGGGTSGSVVATRLAEDRRNSVMMVEAGGDPLLISFLAGLFSLLPHTINDQNYTSTHDSYAASSQNNYTMLTTGHCLGGSATINHFLHIRGSPPDFDYWAEASQDESWKYENILKYFIKSERVDDKEIIEKHGYYHGTNGPMGITRQLEDDKVGSYLDSLKELGNPILLDLNANQSVGYTQSQYMLADQKRQSPGYSYLRRIKDYDNFHVSKHTRASKILFEGNVAVAVEVFYKGEAYILKANKKIILCAGVFNTPQILMLSGIGPEDHLKAMNIEVKSNLPVGDNLMDQVSITVVHKTKKYLLPIPNPTFLPPLTMIPFPVIVGSISLNKSNILTPDYQTYNLLFAHDTPLLALACRPVFGYRDDICNRWIKQLVSRDAFYSIIVNVQPKSRGTIRLKSLNPFDSPIIKTNFLKEQQDIDDMVKYVKDFIKIGDTKFFKENDAELVGLDLPECADKDVGSDEFWKCYILNTAISVFHSSCTCPMGSVVDGSLKLKGFENLHIIDASVMPRLPRSAPNAAIIMLAEKGADIIKSEPNY